VAIGLLNLQAIREARRWRPEVVISGHIVTSPAARVIDRMIHAPYIQYLYADEVPGRPRLTRFALARAAAVVTISAHTDAMARAYGANPARVHRIPPGVDPPAGRAQRRSERPLVLTVSRLGDAYKGHDVMIDALPAIRAAVPDVLWVVVGDGPLRGHYERLVRARGLDRSVQFAGAVSDEERDAWLDRAHLLVMPSRVPKRGGGEGFGIAYLEAAAHGLPVVAGRDGGAPDAVVDGETGLLVDATDPVAVASAVKHLLLDRAHADALGKAGAVRAREFSWPRAAQRVCDLADRLAVGRP
jgi:phosphatidylinositol alpha-1,6-mannosyltransferase